MQTPWKIRSQEFFYELLFFLVKIWGFCKILEEFFGVSSKTKLWFLIQEFIFKILFRNLGFGQDLISIIRGFIGSKSLFFNCGILLQIFVLLSGIFTRNLGPKILGVYSETKIYLSIEKFFFKSLLLWVENFTWNLRNLGFWRHLGGILKDSLEMKLCS